MVATGRSYEGFWTQWTVGTAEWSDMRMGRPPEDDLYYDFFKAKHTTDYLEKYVDRRCFAGQSLRDRMHFGLKVKAITKSLGIWTVQGETAVFRAPKVIIACGLTSAPNMPALAGQEKFEAPVIHQEDFGRSSILSSSDYQNITVLGGGKSAADMVYAAVKAGKSVSWIIRTSGTGPGYFVSPKGIGPYKNAFEIGSTRIAASLSPSIFAPNNCWTRFLNCNSLGQKLVRSVWEGADKETREGADFNGRPKALGGFHNLKPQTPYVFPHIE